MLVRHSTILWTGTKNSKGTMRADAELNGIGIKTMHTSVGHDISHSRIILVLRFISIPMHFPSLTYNTTPILTEKASYSCFIQLLPHPSHVYDSGCCSNYNLHPLQVLASINSPVIILLHVYTDKSKLY
ncbi:hypothetical protein QQP08_000088 [Theobroma cacao]|nr:hypothetical protein QQP08_000088 [Theobroma cacao]